MSRIFDMASGQALSAREAPTDTKFEINPTDYFECHQTTQQLALRLLTVAESEQQQPAPRPRPWFF